MIRGKELGADFRAVDDRGVKRGQDVDVRRQVRKGEAGDLCHGFDLSNMGRTKARLDCISWISP